MFIKDPLASGGRPSVVSLWRPNPHAHRQSESHLEVAFVKSTSIGPMGYLPTSLFGQPALLNVIVANLEDPQPSHSRFIDLGCEPLGKGSLYAFTTQFDYWLEREMDRSQWRVVSPGETMTVRYTNSVVLMRL